jgi:hypothetical protein
VDVTGDIKNRQSKSRRIQLFIKVRGLCFSHPAPLLWTRPGSLVIRSHFLLLLFFFFFFYFFFYLFFKILFIGFSFPAKLIGAAQMRNRGENETDYVVFSSVKLRDKKNKKKEKIKKKKKTSAC